MNQQVTSAFDPDCPQFDLAPTSPELTQAPDTRHKGEIAQLRVQLECAKRGYYCSRPTMEGCRYDLVVDIYGKLSRAQVKYAGVTRDGIVRVSLEKFSGGVKSSISRTYSALEIDVLLVYVAAIDRILWIPPDVWAGKCAIHLRLTPAANGQKKGILLIDDYVW